MDSLGPAVCKLQGRRSYLLPFPIGPSARSRIPHPHRPCLPSTEFSFLKSVQLHESNIRTSCDHPTLYATMICTFFEQLLCCNFYIPTLHLILQWRRTPSQHRYFRFDSRFYILVLYYLHLPKHYFMQSL